MKKRDSNQQKIQIFLMIAVIMASVILTGCAGASAPTSATTVPTPSTASKPTPKPTVDDKLVGYWTNEPGRLKVFLDGLGKPGQPVPIGEWYVFDSEGRYYRIARFMTFAIGGIMVEEGRYEAKSGVIRLFDRTESFFPDEGSPQKAKFREALTADETYYYRLDVDQSTDALFLKTNPSVDAVRFLRCTD